MSTDSSSGHNKLKLQITAFLFNSRADVLRDEMYRALCLHVLKEVGEPCPLEQIVELVAYAIESKVEITEGLKTIVAEALKTLADRGELIHDGKTYTINPDKPLGVPDTREELQLQNEIYEEIKYIALSINQGISEEHIKKLFEFYLYVCDIIAKDRMIKVVRTGEINNTEMGSEAVSVAVEKAKEDFRIENMIDFDEFAEKCFVNPGDKLSQYEINLLQVNIIMQLLAWDPSLEKLKDKILTGKTLYLDSSILFSLALGTDPLNEFLQNLIVASIKEFKVKVLVHEITLQEYDLVVQRHSEEFYRQHFNIRQVIIVAQKDGVSFRSVIGNDIFYDYVTHHHEHIDLGSWQRYTNDIGVDALRTKLNSMGIQIDTQSHFVPPDEFYPIKDNMVRASMDQVRKGKRLAGKSDVTHDAQLYYLIDSCRQQKERSSFGYDIYLLTLDGSLTNFARYQGITWLETYFMYPNQWYEISFPFLRMKLKDSKAIAQSYASMSFSSLFAKLETFIPLGVFGYIFEHGGAGLTLQSIQEIVESLTEERIFERLDPANKNLKDREESKIRLERSIIEKALEESKTIKNLEKEKLKLEEEKKELEHSVVEKKETIKDLENKASIKESEVVFLDKQLADQKNVQDIYQSSEELRNQLEQEYQEKIKEIQSKHKEELENIANKTEISKAIIENKDDKLKYLEENLEILLANTKKADKERENERLRRQQLNTNLKKIAITILMVVGALLSIILSFQSSINIWAIVTSVGLMILGVAAYHWSKNYWSSFLLYGLGLLIVGYYLMAINQRENLLWLIPMIWELVIFGTEKIFSAKSN